MASPGDRHLETTTRRVTTLTRGETVVRTMTLVRTLPAAAPQVWSALTDPGRLASWYRPVEGELVEGGSYRFPADENGPGVGGDVVACRAPERLSLTWQREGTPSWVDLSLRPAAGGTLLQLDHAVPIDQQLHQHGPAGVGLAWELALVALAGHLGRPDAPRDAEVTGLLGPAAAQWAEAAIADGADPATARAQADRALQTYAG